MMSFDFNLFDKVFDINYCNEDAIVKVHCYYVAELQFNGGDIGRTFVVLNVLESGKEDLQVDTPLTLEIIPTDKHRLGFVFSEVSEETNKIVLDFMSTAPENEQQDLEQDEPEKRIGFR